MQCPNCTTPVEETEVVCPYCHFPLAEPEFPPYLDEVDERGGEVVQLFPSIGEPPDDLFPDGSPTATDQEEALLEELDDESLERHPSNPTDELPSMVSSRNYYLIRGYFGGSSVKRELHWVQASTDGVAKKILRDYAKAVKLVLNPAEGQPTFPQREANPGKYYAAKDAALEVLKISHNVPRKFVYREKSKSVPVLVEL